MSAPIPRLRALLLTLALLPALLPAAEDPLQAARALLEAGKAQAAYEQLLPLLEQRAGDASYNRILADAALESGHAMEALFALERVLTQHPDDARSRIQMGRALLALGEIETAREQFSRVLGQSGVPESLLARARNYIDLIDRPGADTSRARFTGRLSLDGGWDSNVNAATVERDIIVPAFGIPVILPDSGVRQSDGFLRIGGRGTANVPVAPHVRLIADVRMAQRINRTKRVFDQGDFNADVGISWLLRKHTLTAAVQYHAFTLDRKRYRNAAGGTLQWNWAVTPDRNLNAFVQHVGLDYPGQAVRKAARTLVGMGWSEATSGGIEQVYLRLYGGRERNREGLDYLSSDLIGIGFGGGAFLGPKWRSQVDVALEQRRYRDEEPLFETRREDTWLRARAGVDYIGIRNWHVNPFIAWDDNQSTIELNRYERWRVGVSLRRDFR